MKEIFDVKHYDVKETGEILGISTTSVHNYIKDGTMIASKIGGRWLLKEEDIKAYVENASTSNIKRDTNK